jgi:uncharacterized protein (TIGR03437 family)
MQWARIAAMVLTSWCAVAGDKPTAHVAPGYTVASIVNAADNRSGLLAPNAIGTIYGTNLAYGTATLTPADVRDGVLPTVLGDSETQVFFGNYPADLYYVSPTQINFLVPPMLLPGPLPVYIAVDALHGPILDLTLTPAAPAMFQMDAHTIIGTRADGSLLTPSSPAKPGDVVVLYATGLGTTSPPAVYGELPVAAAPLASDVKLAVLLDGVAVDPGNIQYAGVAPGYAGLYQINLQLPTSTGANPEIQLAIGGASSVAGVHLPVGL